MNIRVLKALVIKETLQIWRDPSTILIAFVLPLILLFIFGYGVNLDTSRLKVGLVLESYDPTVISLTKAFTNSRFFDVTMSRNRSQFKEDITSGRLRGIIDIPQRFTANLLNPTAMASLQIISDGSEPSIAASVQNYSIGALQLWLNEQALNQGQLQGGQPLISLEPRYWYNQELKSRNFLLPGSIVIIMTIIGALLTALVIAREWERGTMEALLATPVSTLEILLGKFIPYFILGMSSMLLCTFIAIFFYNVPFRGTIGALCLTSSVFLTAALGQGLLISTVAKDQFLASQMALFSAFLPAFILSGFIFEISSMPAPIRALTHIFAARYFVTTLQTLFLTGNIWPLLLQCLLIMLFIGLLFLFITARKTRKRLDQ